jgi:hypothetical protein
VEPTKSVLPHVKQTCVFALGWVYGSCTVFWRIEGVKQRHTIFHARVGPVLFHKKHVEARYVELVFLHQMGSVGHVVHFDSSRP